MDWAIDRRPALAAANAVNSAPPRVAEVATGEDDGSLSVPDHLPGGGLADDEPGTAAQPPDLLEHGGLDVQERLPVLGAGVEDGDVQAPQPRDLVEHGMYLVVETKVRRPDHRLAALGGDFGGYPLQFLLLAGHQNRQMPRPRESARDRLAETVADPCDERERPLAHVAACADCGARCGLGLRRRHRDVLQPRPPVLGHRMASGGQRIEPEILSCGQQVPMHVAVHVDHDAGGDVGLGQPFARGVGLPDHGVERLDGGRELTAPSLDPRLVAQLGPAADAPRTAAPVPCR